MNNFFENSMNNSNKLRENRNILHIKLDEKMNPFEY